MSRKKLRHLGMFLLCAVLLSGILYKVIIFYRTNNAEQTESTDDEKQIFLKEHVYGIWKLEERVYTLKNTEMDFSDEGINALQNMTFYISPYQVSFLDKEYNLFQDPKDAYLFGMYGGYAQVFYPDYEVSDVLQIDLTENVRGYEQVTNIYSQCGYDEIFFHDMGVKKICDISYRENMYKGYYNPCYYGQLPDRFWVDMDQPDVLYLEFCGIWRLQRQDDILYDRGMEENSDD